jgi:Protein of unknown function (DUF4199)
MQIKIILKWAIMGAMLTMAFLTLEYILGFQSTLIAYHPYFSMLGLVIPIYCLHQTISALKAARGGSITFTQGFIGAMVGVAMTTVLAPLVNYAFLIYINPQFFPTMIAYTVDQAAAHGMTPVQAKAYAEGYFNLPSYTRQTLVMVPIMGCIISAISAWRQSRDVTRK